MTEQKALTLILSKTERFPEIHIERSAEFVSINQHMCTVQPQKTAPGKEQLPETIKQKSVLRSHRIKNHSSFRQPAWKGLLDIWSLQHRNSKDLPY